MESKGTDIEFHSYDNYNKVCGKLKGVFTLNPRVRNVFLQAEQDNQAVSIAKDVDQPEIGTHEHFEQQRQPEKQRRS
uniref:Uncharacterized protein n=1 Tax=Solanum tuberosum TaxID=4113 RepID=M1BRJ9_SOLTU